MGAMASQITSLTIVYSTVHSGADQRKHQSSVSQAFVQGIHRWPVNSRHRWPVTRKIFPFDDVIMLYIEWNLETRCENILKWLPYDFISEKSTSIHVMAWFRPTKSHHLSQCWPRSMSLYDRVNSIRNMIGIKHSVYAERTSVVSLFFKRSFRYA